MIPLAILPIIYVWNGAQKDISETTTLLLVSLAVLCKMGSMQTPVLISVLTPVPKRQISMVKTSMMATKLVSPPAQLQVSSQTPSTGPVFPYATQPKVYTVIHLTGVAMNAALQATGIPSIPNVWLSAHGYLSSSSGTTLL